MTTLHQNRLLLIKLFGLEWVIKRDDEIKKLTKCKKLKL